MEIYTSSNVYNFVKESIKIKEVNKMKLKKDDDCDETVEDTYKKNIEKYNFDYSKFDKCIKKFEKEEEKEKEKEKEKENNVNNNNLCVSSHDHSKERQLYEKSTEDKLKAAEAFNEEGKIAFYDKKYKTACVFFRRGLIQLDYSFPETTEEIQKQQKIEINLHLNMALTKFHMNNYHDCINECSIVLSIDKNNSKAHYRKGKAYLSLDLYKEAKESFLKALELNPNDSVVKKSLTSLKMKIENYNKKNKRIYSKIFASYKKINNDDDFENNICTNNNDIDNENKNFNNNKNNNIENNSQNKKDDKKENQNNNNNNNITNTIENNTIPDNQNINLNNNTENNNGIYKKTTNKKVQIETTDKREKLSFRNIMVINMNKFQALLKNKTLLQISLLILLSFFLISLFISYNTLVYYFFFLLILSLLYFSIL